MAVKKKNPTLRRAPRHNPIGRRQSQVGEGHAGRAVRPGALDGPGTMGEGEEAPREVSDTVELSRELFDTPFIKDS
jgi:hypothetical protein